jgi:hypothetical protein
MASITMWQAFMSAGDCAILMRPVAASASSLLMLPFSAARPSIFSMKSRASSAAPGRASIISTVHAAGGGHLHDAAPHGAGTDHADGEIGSVGIKAMHEPFCEILIKTVCYAATFSGP